VAVLTVIVLGDFVNTTMFSSISLPPRDASGGGTMPIMAAVRHHKQDCMIELVSRPTRHRIGYFGGVFPNQSVGLVLEKLNPTRQKHATQKYKKLRKTAEEPRDALC